MRCRQLWSSRLKRWKAIAARFPMPLRARGVRVSSHSVRARSAEASQPQIELFLSKKNRALANITVVIKSPSFNAIYLKYAHVALSGHA